MLRWLTATLAAVLIAAAAWVVSQFVFGLEIGLAVAIATLVVGFFAAPLTKWANESPPTAAVKPEPVAAPVARVFNVGPRNLHFAGRETALRSLHDQLHSGGPVVVQALYGMGGVGKSALAVEYAHRYASEYDVVWWIDAQRANSIAEQLTQLAVDADWVAPHTESSVAVAEVRRRLTRMNRWLLVFDNAEGPQEVRPWLALGTGHILITSRNPSWGPIAQPIEINLFTRAESVEFLRRAVPTLAPVDADDIAARTGDLPLALSQAAGVLSETRMPSAIYLKELASHAAHVMSSREPAGYDVPLAAAIRVSVRRLTEEDPAALYLLQLCALLAPDPVPLDLLFPPPEGVIDEPLASVAANAFDLNVCVGRLGRLGLARRSDEGIEVHRLTQAVLVDQMDPKERLELQDQVDRLLVAVAPEDSDDPELWPQWSRLLPHIRTLDLDTCANEELRALANDSIRYLLNRGEIEPAREFAEWVGEAWLERLGADDPNTLLAANHLARAYRELGRNAEAVELSRDLLERYRLTWGVDHPATLAAATGLAASLRALGRADEALALDEDTLAHKRRVLGENDRSTLVSANGLAADLRELKRVEEALALDQDTWARKRSTLGEDKPTTLTSASNVATDLRLLGRVREALDLERDTLTRRRRVLGDNHPDTLASAAKVADDEQAL